MTHTERLPSIAGLLREGIFSTFSDHRGLLHYGMITTLALTAVWYLGNSLMATVGGELGLVVVAFCWQRRYLVGPGKEGLHFCRWDDEARRFAGLVLAYVLRAVVLFGAMMVVVYALGPATITLLSLHVCLGPEEFVDPAAVTLVDAFSHFSECHSLVAGSVHFLAYPALVVATARFLLVFPAYASGARMRWLQSWTLCRGLGLRLGVVLLLLAWMPERAVAALYFFLPVTVQESIVGDVVITFLIAGARVLGLLVALNVTACLYKRLTVPVNVSASD